MGIGRTVPSPPWKTFDKLCISSEFYHLDWGDSVTGATRVSQKFRWKIELLLPLQLLKLD